ncbi:MAG: hypothetical protein ACJ76J_05825 [Thermoanaerobaculia bacterium]
MRETSKEQWERIRARGKRHFVAREMAALGIIPTVATVLVYGSKFLWTGSFEIDPTVYGSTVLTTIFFLFWGYYRAGDDWSFLEERYSPSPTLETLTGYEKSKPDREVEAGTEPNPGPQPDGTAGAAPRG